MEHDTNQLPHIVEVGDRKFRSAAEHDHPERPVWTPEKILAMDLRLTETGDLLQGGNHILGFADEAPVDGFEWTNVLVAACKVQAIVSVGFVESSQIPYPSLIPKMHNPELDWTGADIDALPDIVQGAVMAAVCAYTGDSIVES